MLKRIFLLGGYIVLMATPVAAQDFGWDGFYAGVIGDIGRQELNYDEHLIGGAVGVRYSVGENLVVGGEGHLSTGFVENIAMNEVGVEAQVGTGIGQNVLLLATGGAAYRSSALWNQVIGVVGVGFEYAANSQVVFRGKVEYLVGAGTSNSPSFRAQGAVLFDMN
jgi:hypothetical protein